MCALPPLEGLNAEERFLLLFALPPSEREVARESVTDGAFVPSHEPQSGSSQPPSEREVARESVTEGAFVLSHEPPSGSISRAQGAHITSGEADLYHEPHRGSISRTAQPSHSPASRLQALEALIEKHPCISLSALAVDGKAVASLGYCGKAIGEALAFLLFEVMGGRVKNEREALLSHLSLRA